MKKIRTKLLIAMLAIAITIAAILSIVSIYSINQSTQGTMEDSVKPLAFQSAKNFNTTIRQYTSNISSVAKSSSFVSAANDSERLSILKKEFTGGINENCTFAVLGSDGTVLTSDNKDITETIDGAFVTESVKKTAVVITDIIPSGDNIYFSILQSVADSDGRTVVAAVTINTEALKSLITDSAFGDSGYAYLVDENGTVLIHKDNQLALESFNAIEQAQSDSDYKDLAKAMEKIISDDNGYCSYSYGGTTYIAGYSSTEYFDGTLVMVSDTNDFTSSTASALRNIIIIGIALIGLTIFVSLLFAKIITKPIISATQRIRLLAQGNLTDPVDVWYSKDELGILTNSLEETIVSLRQYINQITIALTQISEGNLCHRMEGTFKGDFEQIKRTFNEILDSLSDTFASINMSAEQVTSGAVQVSNSAQAVSQGSTQQASAIEELSATLNDVSKQVQQNSKNAKDAYSIVSKSTHEIGDCNDDMTSMLNAMNAIHTSSAEIAKIIKVIDEISFQTNILALNAAVEAAREGSKGFGVVADEVRLLASRSAEAAKQTAALIENSTSAVSKGSEIAEKTASSLNNIVNSSNEILVLMKNITEASEAQSEAIVQINTGLDQVSAVVSANTSSSVGTASASEELSSQSLILKNMIARFKLVSDDGKKKSSSKKYSYDFDDLPDANEPADDNEPDIDDDISMFTQSSEDDKY